MEKKRKNRRRGRIRKHNGKGKREGGMGERKRAATTSHRQSEVLFVLAVDSQSKVLVAGLGEAVLFIQNVQDPHQLCLH